MRSDRTDRAFRIWNSRGTWFWLVVPDDRNAGAIGATASKAEAIGEAQAAALSTPDVGGLDRGNSTIISRSQPNQKGAGLDVLASCCRPEPGVRVRPDRERYLNLWRDLLRSYSAYSESA
jgi:hypothetical protein